MNTAKLTNYHIFITFLKLGCIGFGGPAAHLVLFHNILIKKMRWLDEAQYYQILALAQILPGPTSSQVGISIGYLKNGYLGAFCAWLGFTLPSALLMASSALFGQYIFNTLNNIFFHIIQLIVLSVVIWAFWQMLTTLCHQFWQYILMIFSAVFIYTVPMAMNQFIVIFIAALVGGFLAKEQQQKEIFLKDSEAKLTAIKNSKAYIWLFIFIVPFFCLPLFNYFSPSVLIQSIEGFYQSASLVFGGGHVILPLLHQEFVSTGLISNDKFDLGYALVQFVPGPLFSFSSYLGALLPLTSSVTLNIIIASFIIFVPSFFLVFGTLPYWSWLMRQKIIYKSLQGINAAVVGLLLCLIYQMSEKYIIQSTDIIFVIILIFLLKMKFPVWLVLLSTFFTYYFYLNHYIM